MSWPKILVLPGPFVPGLSHFEEGAAVDRRGDLVMGSPLLDGLEAFLAEYDTDAHGTQYQIDDFQGAINHPRLTKKALSALREKGLGVSIHWALVDVDNPGHAPWAGDVDAHAKTLRAQLDGQPLTEGASFYFTRAGYRLLWALEEPVPVGEAEPLLDALLYNLRRAGIHGDQACTDWTRLFRMPRVTREGKRLDLPLDISPEAPRLDLRALDPIPSSKPEYARHVFTDGIREIASIQFDPNYDGGRGESGGNNRAFRAAVRLANFIPEPWHAWTAEELFDSLISLPQAAFVPGYERTIESAIDKGMGEPAPVPQWLEKRRRAMLRATKREIKNFEWTEDEEGKPKRERMELQDIVADVHDITDGWPALCSGALFAPGYQDDVLWMHSPADCVAWLSGFARVSWARSAGGVALASETHLLAALKQGAKQRFEAITDVQHSPPIKGFHYTKRLEEPGDGSALRAFLAMMNVESEADRDLIEALIMSAMWGGRPGSRPAFAFTTKHGRGVGKTSTAAAVARIFGGALWFGADDKWERVLERLLTDSASPRRFCIVDNLKGAYSRPDLESAITAPVISGRKMYVGDSWRPNHMTWMITANSPQLSTDLASRSVVIEIGPQKHSDRFEESHIELLESRGDELLGDARARLLGPSKSRVQSDRFGAWCDCILSKFENGQELAKLILERRDECDEERAECAEVARVLCSWLAKRDDLVPGEDYTISTVDLLGALREGIWPDVTTPRKLWTRLSPLLGNGDLRGFRRSHGGRGGRGVVVFIGGELADVANVPF